MEDNQERGAVILQNWTNTPDNTQTTSNNKYHQMPRKQGVQVTGFSNGAAMLEFRINDATNGVFHKQPRKKRLSERQRYLAYITMELESGMYLYLMMNEGRQMVLPANQEPRPVRLRIPVSDLVN